MEAAKHLISTDLVKTVDLKTNPSRLITFCTYEI
jgi:hypothetical protein